MTHTATSETTPAFDQAAITEHARLVHGLAAGIDGLIVVTVFHANPSGEKDTQGVVSHHRVGDIDGTVDSVMAHAATPNANVYLVPAVMRPDLPRGRKGTERDVIAVLALVADYDDDTGKTGEMPIVPNYTIESSPGNFQHFVLLDQPLPPTEAKELAAALKRASGADHGTADVSHTWRIPGCLNWPNKKKLERGRGADPAPVAIARPWAGDLTAAADLRRALVPWHQSADDRAPVAIGDLPDVYGIVVSQAAAEKLAADDVGDRSAHAARVVEQLAYDGHSAEAACALFLSATGNWIQRYTSEEGARADFTRLWAKPAAQGHVKLKEAGTMLAAAITRKREPRQAANDNNPGPISAELLLGMDFPPVSYVVDGYVPEGLTILAGRPKLGKSWMALGLCVAIATGGNTLGVECDEGDVFYLALEDNRRRLKERLNVVLRPLQTRPDMSRLTLHTKSAMIGKGLVEELEAWRKSASDPRLIIIDTLSKIRPPKKANQDSYAADYDAIAPLQQYAGEHGIAIVVVHHVRKAEADDPLESVSGTNGLTGAADTILVLTRTTDGPKLYGRGRDIEEIEKALRFDQGVWSVLGDADDVKQSYQRRKILDVLTAATHALTPKEIATEAGMKEGNVKYLLGKMVPAGTAEKVGYGQYKLPGRQ